MIKKNKRLVAFLIAVPLLLLIPFIAMQFTNEVNWTLADFAVMGFLLVSLGLLFELITRKISKTNQRIALYVVIIVVFFLIWAELAVGIFGTPFSGQ